MHLVLFSRTKIFKTRYIVMFHVPHALVTVGRAEAEDQSTATRPQTDPEPADGDQGLWWRPL